MSISRQTREILTEIEILGATERNVVTGVDETPIDISSSSSTVSSTFIVQPRILIYIFQYASKKDCIYNFWEDYSGKKKRKVENVAEDSYFAITKEERISTRLKFKERKSHLKVGDFYIHPNEHFRTRLSCHTETRIVSILIYKHLVVHVDNNVPHILNWKVSDSPTYAGLTNDEALQHCPTTEEKTKLKIAAFFKDAGANYVSSRGFQNEDYNISPPPHLRTMEQQPKHPHSQNTEQQFILRCDLSGSKDDLKAEVQQLRNEVSMLTDTVATLNKYVVSFFGKIFEHLKIKK
ncbi:hypothetical protein K7X08_034208 [Anisodus acutangulus]|uniref:Uncharacterized protein n=1 Tax=Anisodus acutangulus TaxID=402998 RepID=A0A9Q1LF01_9SOLA|nr:hypothetical protein K7X08_034208 [Anisodus acutangulus]